MGLDQRSKRYCDTCGSTIAKAQRVFNGQDFCGTCYKREFIKAECDRCGGGIRVHRHLQLDRVCHACAVAERKCLRCDDPVPKAGKMVEGKAVCPSCAPYYAEKRLCPCCGALAMRLSRSRKLGYDDPVCDRCLTRTHKTCSRCRKSRPVALRVSPKERYCAACTPGHEISHPCDMCGVAVPGSGKGHCRACQNLKRLLAHVTDEASRAGALFERFIFWMHARQGSDPSLVKKTMRHRAFFVVLTELQAKGPLNGGILLARFGTAELRRHKLATDFLAERLHISIDSAEKECSAQAAMIASLLVSMQAEPYADLLYGFVEWLEQKPVKPRTVRAYLTAAKAFCAFAGVTAPWRPDLMLTFVRRQPGFHASLSCFVTYCRDRLGWAVSMPAPPEVGDGISNDARHIRKMLAELGAKDPADIPTESLEDLFCRLFDYAPGEGSAPFETLRRARDGKWSFRDRGRVDVPDALAPFAEELRRRYQE